MSESIAPRVNSATASVGASGVLNTWMLFFRAESKSMLLMPTPTREMTRRAGDFEKTRSLRVSRPAMRPWVPLRREMSSSSERVRLKGLRVTWQPAFRRISRGRGFVSAKEEVLIAILGELFIEVEL